MNWKRSRVVAPRRIAKGRRPELAASIMGALLVCLVAAASAPLANSMTTNASLASVKIQVPYSAVPEEAIMIVVGTALIGLASAVRRVG